MIIYWTSGLTRVFRQKQNLAKLPLADCCPGRSSSCCGLCWGDETCEDSNNTSLWEQQPKQEDKVGKRASSEAILSNNSKYVKG